ncbi:hypothetical protein GCM10010429_14040 [Micromonospora olivasterospora]|uniref:Acetyltransferase (GNAT) family protein n=1 Tax=Micromonospora olivasterospora TaxID=1880 RepID=A0A562IFQ8_MICOL|nr:hypothetical protein JD77_04668 [Micromonospora olivasterospora]
MPTPADASPAAPAAQARNAWALYQRNGFRDTGELGDLMPDGVRREHIMTKSLVA